MKTWKLVSGILSMVLFALVMAQSCIVGLGNSIAENGEYGGSAGIVLSFLMLSGAIVSVKTSRKGENEGCISLIILYGIAAFFGFAFSGSFSDLKIWSSWCLTNSIVPTIAMIKKNRKEGENSYGVLAIESSIICLIFIKSFIIGMIFGLSSIVFASFGIAENEKDYISCTWRVMSIAVSEAVLLCYFHFGISAII